MPIVGLIILAAGASTRMGTPKQLLLFQGRSLLRSMAEAASRLAVIRLCLHWVHKLIESSERCIPLSCIVL